MLDAARARQVPRHARTGHDHARGRPHLRARRAAPGGGRPARPAGPRRGARGGRGRGGPHLLRGHARRGAAPAHGGARGPRHRRTTWPPTGWRGSPPAEASYAGVRVQTRGGLSHAGGHARSTFLRSRRRAGRACAGPRARPRGAALQRSHLRAHDEPLRRRPGRERVRAHDEPRARLRRLPARLRRPPEQHARRVRPAHRPAGARGADGEHDVADRRARRRRPRARGWSGRGHAPSPRARAGALGDPGRGPHTAGRRRPAAAPLHRRDRPPRARLRGRARSTRCASEGYDVRLWDELHHYFGGVSVVGRTGAGADPRRSGLALPLG